MTTKNSVISITNAKIAPEFTAATVKIIGSISFQLMLLRLLYISGPKMKCTVKFFNNIRYFKLPEVPFREK